MSRMTLLEMVQDILNDMDGDEVDTILETIESAQVAQILKTSYFELMANRNWPHLKTTFDLDEYSTTTTPVTMVIPANIKEVEWIKYNIRSSTDTKDKYRTIEYKYPEDFLEVMNNRDSSASEVSKLSVATGLYLNVRRDKAPQYWTSFDDTYAFFDSYDSAVESYIHANKTSCYGVRTPTWTHTDAAYPDLPYEAFPVLLEEAKSTAFYVLRQVANEKAEQKATRQQRWLSRKAWRAKGGVRYPNYGRKKAFSGYEKNPLLDKG